MFQVFKKEYSSFKLLLLVLLQEVKRVGVQQQGEGRKS